MPAKTDQLQIRVTRSQKTELKRLARSAGLDVSAYVLARALPSRSLHFRRLVEGLRDTVDWRFALAELNDLLASLSAIELEHAVAGAELEGLSPYLKNYVSALVEQASYLARIEPPAWCSEVEPLEEPHFVTELRSLRPHLLRAAPVPFKRRNIFLDAALGDRV